MSRGQAPISAACLKAITHAAVPRYDAYGLSLTSSFGLAELEPTEPAFNVSAADVRITRERVDGPMPQSGQDRLIHCTEDSVYFAWAGLGRFRVTAGSAVAVDLDAETDDMVLSPFLVGPILAALLHQRGHCLLHGSAVSLPGQGTTIFVGDNGAGKSSLAALLVSHDGTLVNDDIAALSNHKTCVPRVVPGFPTMRLSPNVIALLDPACGACLSNMPAGAMKQRFRFNRFDRDANDLDRICIVERGAAPARVDLAPADALAALMRYSYLPKFGTGALIGSAAARHFAFCADLARTVPVSRLTVASTLIETAQAVPAIACLLATQAKNTGQK